MSTDNNRELEACLESIEANLSRLQVSGYAAIYMGDAFKLLIRAKELVKTIGEEAANG